MELQLQGGRDGGGVWRVLGGFSGQNLIHLRIKRKKNLYHEKGERVPY